MNLVPKRLSPAERCYRDLADHIGSCRRCRAVGAQDAARSSLCVTARSLYALWDKELGRAERFARGEA